MLIKKNITDKKGTDGNKKTPNLKKFLKEILPFPKAFIYFI